MKGVIEQWLISSDREGVWALSACVWEELRMRGQGGYWESRHAWAFKCASEWGKESEGQSPLWGKPGWNRRRETVKIGEDRVYRKSALGVLWKLMLWVWTEQNCKCGYYVNTVHNSKSLEGSNEIIFLRALWQVWRKMFVVEIKTLDIESEQTELKKPLVLSFVSGPWASGETITVLFQEVLGALILGIDWI